ncbi:hypothetical protein AAMO2058_000050900 [Amorphochlora amoebiformis]
MDAYLPESVDTLPETSNTGFADGGLDIKGQELLKSLSERLDTQFAETNRAYEDLKAERNRTEIEWFVSKITLSELENVEFEGNRAQYSAMRNLSWKINSIKCDQALKIGSGDSADKAKDNPASSRMLGLNSVTRNYTLDPMVLLAIERSLDEKCKALMGFIDLVVAKTSNAVLETKKGESKATAYDLVGKAEMSMKKLDQACGIVRDGRTRIAERLFQYFTTLSDVLTRLTRFLSKFYIGQVRNCKSETEYSLVRNTALALKLEALHYEFLGRTYSQVGFLPLQNQTIPRWSLLATPYHKFITTRGKW